MPASSLRPKNSEAPRCGQLFWIRPTLPFESRKPISCSPSSSTRTGSLSAAGSSSESMAGSQYSRKSLPMGVPGPTWAISSFSSWLSIRLRQYGRAVVRFRSLAGREQVELAHPAMSLLVHLARIRLEDDALARPEGAHVHQRLEFIGHLAQEVMRVPLVFHVDVSLGAAERVEVFLHVRHLDVLARNQEADHERRVDHFSEPLLLDDVGLQAEHVGGFDAAVQQLRHAVIRRADELQIDLVRLQKRLERLERREVAARVVADADLAAPEVLRAADGRIGGDVDARGCDGVRVAPHLAVLTGRRHVDCPVASGADVAGASRFHGLERAAADLRRRLLRGLDAAVQVIVAPDAESVDGARPVERVVEALVAEVALVLGDPLLKSVVRLDLERTHQAGFPPKGLTLLSIIAASPLTYRTYISARPRPWARHPRGASPRDVLAHVSHGR